MENRIIQAARICANSEVTTSSDLEWHKACVDILSLGLTKQSLRDYSSEEPANLGLLMEGNTHAAADFIANFLEAYDGMQRSVIVEYQTFIQKFVQYIDNH